MKAGDMDLGIGVIGAGAIGYSHARRLSSRIRGARVVAAYDRDRARADGIGLVAPGSRVHDSVEELVNDPAVDAVLIASPAVVHREHVLLALRAGKFVFCEKPLATTSDDCAKIVDEEVKTGRRLLQLGFMRRFDEGYLALKQIVDRSEFGEILMVHAAHRNVSLPDTFQNSMAVTDCLIHEIDVLRWLTSEEFISAQVLFPKRSRHAPAHLQDPQIFLLEGHGGVRFDVEIMMNARYAYDIRCEIVGEDAVAQLPTPSSPNWSNAGSTRHILPMDWDERFAPTFDVELQAFVDGIQAGVVSGPSAWDGYKAAVVADACVKAQSSGQVETISHSPPPGLYCP